MASNDGNRWLVVGPTGCGKTRFSKSLCIHYLENNPNLRLYVLNSKFGDDFKAWGNEFITDGRVPRVLKKNERIQIWSPYHLIPSQLDLWLDRILHDGPCLLDIDELVHLLYKRKEMSRKLEEICKIGRSRGINLLANTQHLIQLPHTIISQSTYFVRFMLINPYERRLSNMLLKSEEKLLEPDKYGFYQTNLTTLDTCSYYNNYQEFMKELKNGSIT